MRKEFRRLIPLEEARSIIFGHLPAPDEETVPLSRALGSALAEKIVSEVDVPGFNRASMDGYAIRAEDSLEAREDRPKALKLVGSVSTGALPEIEVGKGEVCEVSTGSMMPPGADAVVMIEYSQAEDESVLIYRPVHAGENVQAAGSDIAFGEAVLFPDTKLTAREIGVLSAVGRDRIKVRWLRVAVASTGNELVEPGRSLKLGQIYDINSYSIAAAVEECGATPVRYGILPDDKAAMVKALVKTAKDCGMILVSGSTSAGVSDMVYQVLDEMGETIFHGVNLKPGKPTIFGTIEGKPCIGLPGYPTSALTVFWLLAAPAIRKALGFKSQGYKAKGRLAKPFRSEGRQQMLAVGICGELVYPMDKGSGSITTLSQSDGVVEIPAEVEYLERGEEVEVMLFEELVAPDLTIAGENCPALEAILGALNYQVRFIANGTKRGIISLDDGMADLSSISRQEGEMLNLPQGIVLIRGYTRELGLMAKGPELLDTEKMTKACILGWSRDSEMSRLLQRSLKTIGPQVKDLHIKGQARAHSAVAASVASGKVHLGFGARAAAEAVGLSFKGLASDKIDFLVSRASLDREALRSLISWLRSGDLKNVLPVGISTNESTGEILEGQV